MTANSPDRYIYNFHVKFPGIVYIILFSIFFTGIGLYYYFSVLKPQWLKEEVGQYIDENVGPVYEDANAFAAKSRDIIVSYIRERKEGVPAFVGEIMSIGHKFDKLTNNDDAQRQLIKTVFEKQIFSEIDIKSITKKSIEFYFNDLATSANTLSRKIEEEYPYDITRKVGVNYENISLSYTGMIDYAEALSNDEFYNQFGRAGADLAASAVAGAIASGIASSMSGASSSSGNIFVTIFGMTVGALVDWYLSEKAEQALIAKTNDALDKFGASISAQVHKSLLTEGNKQLDLWKSDLYVAVLSYREAN